MSFIEKSIFCCYRQYSYASHKGFFWFDPPPSPLPPPSSFGSYLPLKMLAFFSFLLGICNTSLVWVWVFTRTNHWGIPLILDKAGQSFSSWNDIFSILICCCRNSRSLCSPSSPVLHTVICKESLWSDKCKLPSDSEEDKDPVGMTCLFLLLPVINGTGWSLSFDVFASFLFIVLP